MDLSCTVQFQGGAVGGPAHLWSVISQTEPHGSRQLRSVSIQYPIQLKKIGREKHPPTRRASLPAKIGAGVLVDSSL